MPGALLYMVSFEARLRFDGLVGGGSDRDLRAEDERIGSGLRWFCTLVHLLVLISWRARSQF